MKVVFSWIVIHRPRLIRLWAGRTGIWGRPGPYVTSPSAPRRPIPGPGRYGCGGKA